MVIFLHGDDTYRSRQKLRELTEKFLREVDPSGANLVTVDGTTASAAELWGAIAAQSFLVRRRCVVVERLCEAAVDTQREVAEFLGKIPEDVIVVCWEGKSCTPKAVSSKRKTGSAAAKRPTKSAATTKGIATQLIAAANHVQEFTPLTGQPLTAWTRAEVERREATITADALRELVAAVGSDLWRMAQEVEKLTLAAADGAITHGLVRTLVDVAPQENIFAFVDAIGRGDAAATLRELRRLEAAGADPHALLAMVHRQLRLLVQASDALEREVPIARLAAELGVHPFVAQKMGTQARSRSCAAWRLLMVQLLDLDRALKSSRAPTIALLERFCLAATMV